MVEPKRIQLSRAKGWRMPENTVNVTRPGPWGNPFIVGKDGDRAYCVELYKHMLNGYLSVVNPGGATIQSLTKTRSFIAENVGTLRGKDLACWCRVDGTPCHADVLLELAAAQPLEDADHPDCTNALDAAGKLDRIRVNEIHRLRAVLEFYANPEIYKPHPHGLAFDDRDLSYRAKAALGDSNEYDPTTQPYDEPFRHVENDGLEECGNFSAADAERPLPKPPVSP